MQPAHFLDYVISMPADARDKVLMARIGLHLLFDPVLYPVDLLEVSVLRPAHTAICESLIQALSFVPRADALQSEESYGVRMLIDVCTHDKVVASKTPFHDRLHYFATIDAKETWITEQRASRHTEIASHARQ